LKEKHPRPLYTEIDDNVFAVDSSNPGFHHVNPGSVAESMFLHQLQTSDGIITSTDELAKAYKKINKNIYIYKNSIDFDIWDKCNSINRDGSRINIVWQGAAHHFDDLKILSDVIPKILKKHGNVHFYFAGMLPDFLRQERTHYFDPVQIIKYPKFISSLKPDIMLAPLFDTEFNRGKSNLRVLEAGAMKKAVVASGNKNLPYAKTIVDGESGLLANTTEEWVEKIDRLILDKNLRVELGNNLYRHIKENYNIKNTAREYEQFLLTRGKKNGKLQGNVPEGAKVHK
jgi:glycosyltransferase involved in cell wall biosynthesis